MSKKSSGDSSLDPITPSSSSSSSDYIKDKSYLNFSNNCNGEENIYNANTNLPVFNIITRKEDIELAIGKNSRAITPRQRAGMVEPISIVKVRKSAFETLIKTLDKFVPYANNKSLKDLYKKIYGKLKDLEDIFSKANTEKEDAMDGGAPVTSRDNMTDKNEDMFKLDAYMFEMIVYAYDAFKNKKDYKSHAFELLRNFMMVSSAKEYLDTGQLYAIIDPTVEHNNNNNWTQNKINARINAYFNSGNIDSSTVPKSYPRKPMLETIDKSATRLTANCYLTAYCNFVLSDDKAITKKIDSIHYIDNADVYLVSTFINSDPFVTYAYNVLLLNDYNDNVYDELKANIEKIRAHFIEININSSIEDEYKAIDYLYYMLANEVTRTFLMKLKTLLQIENTVLIIPKKIYFMASVAAFLYKCHKGNDGTKDNKDEIKKSIINCNFDSLCHDNAESSAYMLVMILMLILKNNEDDIIQNMIEMGYLKKDGGDTIKLNSYLDATIHPKKYRLYKPLEDIKTKSGTKGTPIDDINNEFFITLIENLLKNLNDNQRTIFQVLSSKSAANIEDVGLYTRLYDKSCYAFSVKTGACGDYMALVSNKKSAHLSYKDIQEKLDMNQYIGMTNTYPITSLHAGVILPEYTNCAIDAPLKHSFSLSAVSGIGLNSSSILVTPVTEVDAAAQLMDYSLILPKDVCMPIPVTHLPDPEVGSTFNQFVYNYVYGKKASVNEPLDDGIVLPNSFNNFEKEKYRRLVVSLQQCKFYAGKDADIEKSNNLYGIFQDFLNKIKEVTIRDKFKELIAGTTKLNTKDIVAISVSKNKSKNIPTSNKIERYQATRPTQGKIDAAVSKFVEWLNGVMKEPGYDKKNALLVYYLLRLFLIIINKTSESSNISESEQNELLSLSNSADQLSSGADALTPPSSTANASTYGGSPAMKGGGNVYATPLQMLYSTMFGKFGFKPKKQEMRIVQPQETEDEDDIFEEQEYEPINTLTDYVSYVIDYSLMDKIGTEVPEANGIKVSEELDAVFDGESVDSIIDKLEIDRSDYDNAKKNYTDYKQQLQNTINEVIEYDKVFNKYLNEMKDEVPMNADANPVLTNGDQNKMSVNEASAKHPLGKTAINKVPMESVTGNSLKRPRDENWGMYNRSGIGRDRDFLVFWESRVNPGRRSGWMRQWWLDEEDDELKKMMIEYYNWTIKSHDNPGRRSSKVRDFKELNKMMDKYKEISELLKKSVDEMYGYGRGGSSTRKCKKFKQDKYTRRVSNDKSSINQTRRYKLFKRHYKTRRVIK